MKFNKKILLLIICISAIIISTLIFSLRFQFLSLTINDKYVSKITITPRQPETVNNAQVQIFLNKNNFDFSRLLYEDGSDIRIYDENGNVLKYYIVYVSKTQQRGEIWVNIPTLLPAGNTVTLYMGYGSAKYGYGTPTIFLDTPIDYEDLSVRWTGTVKTIESSTSTAYQKTYSNKLEWTAQWTTGAYAYMYYSYSVNPITVTFWIRRYSSYTGSTGFLIYLNIGGYTYGYVNIRNDGSICIETWSSTISGSNIIPNVPISTNDFTNWRQIIIRIDKNIPQMWLTIKDPYGNVLYETNHIVSVATSNYPDTLLIRNNNCDGTVWFDFHANVRFISQTPTVTVTTEIKSFTFLDYTNLTFPPTTDVSFRVYLGYGTQPIVGEPITLRIEAKGTYAGYESTISTDSNGISTFTFKTPPSTYSPYTLKISATDISNTYNMYVLKGIRIDYTKLQNSYYYNTMGDYDLDIEGLLFDIETSSMITSFTVSPTVIGPDGKTITAIWEKVSNQFAVKAKVYEAYKDKPLETRNIKVNFIIKSSGYFDKNETLTVNMLPPSIIVSHNYPAGIIPKGSDTIKITFLDSQTKQPAQLTLDNINVLITDPNGVTTELKTMSQTDYYFKSTVTETSITIKYPFNTIGQYQIEVMFINIPQAGTQAFTLSVVEQSPFASIPYNWIVIGIIALIVLYLLFGRKKKHEIEI